MKKEFTVKTRKRFSLTEKIKKVKIVKICVKIKVL